MTIDNLPDALAEVERLQAYLKSIGDDEKGHIVRFDSDSETFNAQHPLHERVNQSLLDCPIHEEVQRWIADGGSTEDTWRVVHRDQVPGEEANEWPWLWEKLP